MMRFFRRTCRQWQHEFLAFWGKFNTFYRMIIGIALAMAMVFGARRQVLDSHHHAVTALEKELKGKGVPAHVPPPGSDNEVQEAELQAESLQAALDRERQETRAALEPFRSGSQDRARETVETLTRLIGKHGLMVRSATRCDPLDDFPLARLCQSYLLAGDFAGIFGFLNDIANMKIPCRLRQVALTSQPPSPPPDSFPATTPAVLTLSFIFESFYVEP